MGKQFIGELEQMVLLALLQLGDEAFAPAARVHLRERVGRQVSRGALYRTLDRLEAKGLIRWEFEGSTIPERGGHPMRRIQVTESGVEAVRAARGALVTLWQGLDAILEGEAHR